jgi:hypothetical protein
MFIKLHMCCFCCPGIMNKLIQFMGHLRAERDWLLLLLFLLYCCSLITGSVLPGTFLLEPVVNPTTHASSLRLYQLPYDV